ncbi:MAG: methyltransferase domain-containing protein [Gammaproteobacteria bacterium]|nr:methyltransferase domain-containing protein [Gammaproteobacteria bacterium]
MNSEKSKSTSPGSAPADFSRIRPGDYLYFGNLAPSDRQYQSNRFWGVALAAKYDRDIQHDITAPLPLPDNSISGIQAEDVLEHVLYAKVPGVFDEIYRCLEPGATFRLSVPDYNAPLLRSRSVYNSQGMIICDPAMGGKVSASLNGGLQAEVTTPDGHVWFPTYTLVAAAIINSQIRKSTTITFHQCWVDAQSYVLKDFDEQVFFVRRIPRHDARAQGKPLSIVVDFIK